jgi:hypothetical protein
MASNFASLKKASKNDLEKLTAELQKLSTPAAATSEDTRFWKPEVDKSGNGYAVIRFLPAPAGEDVPFVRIFDHAFQGPSGQWYIEKSLTTLGETDPVSEYNRELWATGSKSNQDQVRKQKRRLSYISNIYVVSDPKHPENEGKVFLYRYGKKIFDKLTAAMEPEFEDENAINPFDLWQGANFKLKIRKVEGYQNYDKSEFEAPAPLLDDDDDLEALWKGEHALQPFLERGQFKTFNELKTRLDRVLGLSGTVTPVQDPPFEVDVEEESVAAKPRPKKKVEEVFEDDDDNFFQKLQEEDD